MADILEFKRPVETEPVHRGEATCTNCRHTWQAVIAGADLADARGWLECPQCTMARGRFKWPHRPAEGTGVFTCACGNDLLLVTNTGGKWAMFCPNCGEDGGFPE